MPRPSTLYRYRSLAGSSKEWVRRSIVDGEHYFTSPLAFNDPFDCRPLVRRAGTEDQLVAYYERVLTKSDPALLPKARLKQAQEFARTAISRARLPKTDGIVAAEFVSNTVATIGVMCLTEVSTDLLMWAHYADSHRGICLGFSADDGPIAQARPVQYQSERPVLNPVRQTPPEMLSAAIFTKSDHWCYEREWRLLAPRRKAGAHRSPAIRITSVILGAQITESDAAAVRQWVAASQASPTVIKAQLCESTFGITLAEA